MHASDDEPQTLVYIWLEFDNLSPNELSMLQWDKRHPEFLILLPILTALGWTGGVSSAFVSCS